VYNNSQTTNFCDNCYYGTYSNQTANAKCELCQPGAYQNYLGRSSCYPCSVGSYTNFSGNSTCSSCSRGYYANVTGSRSCNPCPYFTYQPNFGASNCLNCPTAYTVGQYFCTSNTSTSYTGYTGYTGYPTSYTNTNGGTSGDGGNVASPATLFFSIMGSLTFIVSVGVLCCVCCSRRRSRLSEETRPLTTSRIDARTRPRNQTTNQAVPLGVPRPVVSYTQPRLLPPLPPPRNDAVLTDESAPPAEDVSKQDCIICYDEKRETVLLPCGHITACEKCTRAIIATNPKCPVCRKPVGSFVRMYSV